MEPSTWTERAEHVATRVRAIAQKEQECCSFLRIQMQEGIDEFGLTIAAPEEAPEIADFPYKQFYCE